MLKNSSNEKNFFSKNVTLKKFIITHNINQEKIINIFDNFEKMASEKIRNSYKFIPKFSEKNIKNVFNAIVKIKLLNRCIDVVKLNKKEINNNNDNDLNKKINTLEKFISQMFSVYSKE
jgi:hypothetical protein